MVFDAAVVEVDDCTVVVEVDFVYNNSAGAAEVAGHSMIAEDVAVGHNTTAVVVDEYIAAVAVLPSWHYYHLHHSNYSEVEVVELSPEVEDDTVIVYS